MKLCTYMSVFSDSFQFIDKINTRSITKLLLINCVLNDNELDLYIRQFVQWLLIWKKCSTSENIYDFDNERKLIKNLLHCCQLLDVKGKWIKRECHLVEDLG